MEASCLWLWNDVNKIYVKAQCDASGNLLISGGGGVGYTEIAPSEISPDIATGWYEWDISFIVPEGTVCVEVIGVAMTIGGYEYLGCRSAGSSADRKVPAGSGHIGDRVAETFTCQVSSDRKIDIYQCKVTGSLTNTYYIIGYWL